MVYAPLAAARKNKFGFGAGRSLNFLLRGPHIVSLTQASSSESGIFARGQRGLTAGLILVLVVVAFEGLAVTTIMPVTVRALHGLALYGWSFSGFMLGSLVGTVAAGDYTARRGAVFAFSVALVVFAVGLATCGIAANMLVFIGGRVFEGLGTGAVRALTWFAINQAYSPRDHVRMGATLSSAYIVPTLIGPTAAGIIAELYGWRAVFLALLPLVPVALFLIVHALARLHSPSVGSAVQPRRAAAAMLMALGLTLVLIGLETTSIPMMAACGIVGGATAYVTARRVLPQATLSFGHGLPAILAMRGVLTYGYFGSLAFFPMALELVRGLSPTLAGIGVSAGSIGWTSGSWTAVALDRRFGLTARPQSVRAGLLLIMLGTAGTIGTLIRRLPVGIAFACWGIAGLGMGIAYNTDSVLAIQAQSAHSAATVTSSMQLTDSLGQVLGTGMGGVMLALSIWAKLGTAAGIGITFGLTILVCLIGVLLAPRMSAPPGQAAQAYAATADI
jgi:MFS family permease